MHGVHLLDALLAQEEGIVVPILQKLEVNPGLVQSRAREALDRIARVEGGSEPNLARDLRKALDGAEEMSRELGDEYVSTEHLLLGLTGEKNDAGRILRDAGATTLRGPRRAGSRARLAPGHRRHPRGLATGPWRASAATSPSSPAGASSTR